MKAGFVSSSQVTKYGRLDAEFNLAVKELEEKHADRLKELEADFTQEEVVNNLLKLRTEDMECLSPFLTGSRNKVDRNQYIQAIEKYPYLCALTVELNIDVLKKKAQERIDSANHYLGSLGNLTTKKKNAPKP